MRGGGGQQSNLTHCGCEQCVYTPKLVACKWVWSRLTALENSSRLGHMHFPQGSPRRHQDIFMIHPLTPPPIPPYWQLGPNHMLIQLSANAILVSSGRSLMSGGITPSRHGLQTFNAGALISSVAVKEHGRSPSPPGWACVGDYRNKKIDANFFVSNSTWAAYRPRRYWEWDEDWKEEG